MDGQSIDFNGKELRGIPGYDGYYATADGDVYSTRTGILVLLKQDLHEGYWRVNVRNGVGRSSKVKRPVHQLVLFAFVGPKPFDAAVTRHLNGVSTDNCLHNICWGTVQQNAADAVLHGTAVGLRSGDRHPRTVIADADVRRIVGTPSELAADLADRFGVTKDWILQMQSGRCHRLMPANP